MKELQAELALLSTLEGDAYDDKCREIAARFTSDEERAEIRAYMDSRLDKIGCEVEQLGERLEQLKILKQQLDELREIIPFGYIAKHYFGKSAAWLSQRINGCVVRGQRYTLKPNEVEIFNNALHDIGLKLGSFSIG